MLDENISVLIGDIYAGAHEPGAWARAMWGMIDITDSRFSFVSVVDLKRRGYSSSQMWGPDDGRFIDGMREYSESFFVKDPTLRFAFANPSAGLVGLRDLLTREGRDAERDDFLRWQVGMLRAGDCLVRYTPPRDGLVFGVSLGATEENISHDPTSRTLFAILFGHIRASLELAIRPPDWASNSYPCILLDARGRVLAMSAAAETVLARLDGIIIVDGELRALRPADSHRMDKLIRSAANAQIEGGSGGTITVPRSNGRRDYVLTISPLPIPPSPFAAFRCCVQVRLFDPDARLDPNQPQRWASAFGLTSAEARLLEAWFTSDCNLRRASDFCGVAYATARVQLASIFRKADVRSQSQLVRLLMQIGCRW